MSKNKNTCYRCGGNADSAEIFQGGLRLCMACGDKEFTEEALKSQPSGPVAPEPTCNEVVCHLIAGASWFPCALPKGHDGGHRALGNCFKHGAYYGEPGIPPQCPRWPECALQQAMAPEAIAPEIDRIFETANAERKRGEVHDLSEVYLGQAVAPEPPLKAGDYTEYGIVGQAVAPAGGETPEHSVWIIEIRHGEDGNWSKWEIMRPAEIWKSRDEGRDSVNELTRWHGYKAEYRSVEYSSDTCRQQSQLALLESERDRLRRPLQDAYVIIEALRLSVKWELASEIMAEITRIAPIMEAALAGAPSPQPVHPSEIHAAKLGAKLNAANAALEKMRYDWNCAAKGEDEALRTCRALKAEHEEEKKSLISSFLEAQNEALRLKREFRDVVAQIRRSFILRADLKDYDKYIASTGAPGKGDDNAEKYRWRDSNLR